MNNQRINKLTNFCKQSKPTIFQSVTLSQQFKKACKITIQKMRASFTAQEDMWGDQKEWGIFKYL